MLLALSCAETVLAQAAGVGHLDIHEQPEYRTAVAIQPRVPAADIPGPSFPCEHARSAVEKMLCADAELARLDRRLASLFAGGMEQNQNPEALVRISAVG